MVGGHDRASIVDVMNQPLWSVVDQNRRYWERLAPHRLGLPAEFFLSGGSALTEGELAAFGDVCGSRVLHLACSTGDESLSFAQRGAEVTGVDIAPSHLATARSKAAAVGVGVTYLEQDMMALDPDLTGFDLIYISWRGLCWAPSITAWAQLVAGRLGRGGNLAISEHHPIWEVLSVAEDGSTVVCGDYFGRGRDGYADPAKAPEITRSVGGADLPHRGFVWNLGAVVTAVLEAGLTVRSLRELPDSDMYRGLGNAATTSRRPTS